MANDEGFKMSRRQKRIRLAVVICVLASLVMLVIAFVVLLIILVPKRSSAVLSSEVGINGFNITYCPSTVDVSCCPAINQCTERNFTYSAVGFEFNQVYTIQIENKNFIPIRSGDVTVEVSHGGEEIASGSVPSERVRPRTTTNIQVPVAWRGDRINFSAMRRVMCELSGWTTDGASTNIDKNLVLTVAVEMPNARYLASRLKFSFGSSALTVSLKDLCSALPHNCEIATGYLTRICSV